MAHSILHTMLSLPYSYFAYLPKNSVYVLFCAGQRIANHLLDLSKMAKTFVPTSFQSCAAALFLNELNNIHSICSFRLSPNSLIPSVTQVEDDTVLFTAVSNVTRLHQNAQVQA